MRLTKATIDGLTLPEGRTDHIYWDADLPGFGIRLRASGKRSWIIQYRAGHQQRRTSLGDARKVDADLARKEAKRRLAKVELGHDPRAEQIEAKARGRLTLGSVADQYLDIKKPILRRSSFQASARYLTQHWKPLRNLPVHAVERRDVAARLGEIGKEHGVIAASRARATLSAFFAWSVRQGLCDSNPCIGTNEPAAGIASRDRMLDDSELAVVWRACGDDSFGKIVRLLLLLGCRRDEAGGLRRDEINTDTGLLRIPGSRIKNHRDLVLPLPPMAIEIIASAPRQGDHVFGRVGPFCAWSYSKLALDARITAAEGKPLPAWRLHDLRRSCASGLARIGIDLPTIEQILNHQSGSFAGIVGVYQRHDFIPEKKLALQRWAQHVASLVGGTERTVLPLRQTA
jgi:integrase